jgi:hypothetical protein
MKKNLFISYNALNDFYFDNECEFKSMNECVILASYNVWGMANIKLNHRIFK